MLDINQFKRILLPSGNHYERCVEAFEDTYKTQLPHFPPRCLSVHTNGKEFIRVRSRDIPWLLAKGYAQAGLLFSDIVKEYEKHTSNLHYEVLKRNTLSFRLLFPKEDTKVVMHRLYSPSATPLTIVTAYPKFLNECLVQLRKKGVHLNLELSDFTPTGSVEAMCVLGVADIIADVVQTGISARANNLETIHLSNIYPTVLYRNN